DIRAASAGVDRVIIEIVFHDVLGRYQGRRARARDEIMSWVFRRANADMAKAVEDILICQDVVREHQIGEALGILLLGSLRRHDLGECWGCPEAQARKHCQRQEIEPRHARAPMSIVVERSMMQLADTRQNTGSICINSQSAALALP